MPKFAIIVAGGSGKRMLSETPKQFLLLAERPILMHTIEVFKKADSTINIIVVLPKEHITIWKDLCHQHHFSITHKTIIGGKERFHSVLNGLNSITTETGTVAVHDGVRPFVSYTAINNSFHTAEKKKSAVLSIPLKDSIRSISQGDSKAENRANFRLVQTPQAFDLSLLKKAYQAPYKETFTDDASVFEASGGDINLIEGNYENIKITTPEDLIFGEAILKSF